MEDKNNKIESFKCYSCGQTFETTRNKLSVDLECVDFKCYGSMYVTNTK